MGTVSHNLSILQHQNPVGVQNCADPLRHDEHGRIRRFFMKRLS